MTIDCMYGNTIIMSHRDDILYNIIATATKARTPPRTHSIEHTRHAVPIRLTKTECPRVLRTTISSSLLAHRCSTLFSLSLRVGGGVVGGGGSGFCCCCCCLIFKCVLVYATACASHRSGTLKEP
eukprot:COSAG01_NODE_41117_length_455_cov_2.171348_1_plen_124_part_10